MSRYLRRLGPIAHQKCVAVSKKPRNREMTGRDFDALPDAEKERIYKELDDKTPEQLLRESRPLTKRQRAVHEEIQRSIRKKMGQPKIGK